MALTLVASAFGQQLATTDDGSEVVIASRWRVRGQQGLPDGNYIIQQQNGVWTGLASHVDRTALLGSPFVSGDGRVVGWSRPTSSLDPRRSAVYQGLTGREGVWYLRGALSSNARYLLRFAPFFIGVSALEDLETGQVFSVVDTTLESVANDGTLLVYDEAQGLSMVRPGQAPRQIAKLALRDGRLSADGKHAVVTLRKGEVWWFDLESGRTERVSQSGVGVRGISNDGNLVLYGQSELKLWDSSTLETRQLREQIYGATLSGDGRVVWGLDNVGLFRFVLSTGVEELILPALPYSLLPRTSATPGSAVLFDLSQDVSQPLVFQLPHSIAPTVATQIAKRAVMQVPWEFVSESPSVDVAASMEGHPLEVPVRIGVARGVNPQLALLPRGELQAAQADFDALISAANPAQPGTTIHTWLFGLGPLDRPVATGQPGPSDPPARPLAALTCSLNGIRVLEMPFLAYAVGMVGVYQADLTIPADWPSGVAQLVCESQGQTTVANLPVGFPPV